jgi:hypothetical protein
MNIINKYYLLLIGAILSSGICAQMVKPLPVSYSQGRVEQGIFNQASVGKINISYMNEPLSYSSFQFSPICNFKYTLSKGAIFCRMEDAIYSKFNFWVKFRMGTDDRYSN